MRIAHIIIAHKNPAQVLRLVDRLQHPQFDFYLHIDKKVSIQSFAILNNKVCFIKNRVKCNWGGNSVFLSIFNSLEEVLTYGKNYDFINVLSGQDYPLIPAHSVFDYFENKKGNNFISFDTSSSSRWWKSAASRYEQYHLTDLNLRGKYFYQKIINKITPKRIFPNNLKLYGSNKSTWWTISGECSKYLIEKLHTDNKLMKFLKYSWGTDEFIVATIIMNSPFKDSVVNNNLRYIDWSEENPNPKLLGVNDLKKLKDSKMLFARKFDPYVDEKVLDLIDLSCR